MPCVLLLFSVSVFASSPLDSCLNKSLRKLTEHSYQKTPTAGFDYSSAEWEFMNSQELIYIDHSVKPTPGEYHASNEWDWFKMPRDFEETDVVIGFGTNSAWDIAVRKNAKTLVIGDWAKGPLITQEYFMKPLILASDTPADFISMIAGVPIPESLRSSPINDVFNYIDRYLKTAGSSGANRSEFFEHVITKLKNNTKISDIQLAAVKSYFDDLSNSSKHFNEFKFGPIYGSYVSKFRSKLTKGHGPIYEFFKNRYHPDSLIKSKADPTLIGRPDFSIVSSQMAFDRLKRLFDGNIHYVNASFENENIYWTAKRLGKVSGHKRYTLSITPIERKNSL